MHVSMSVDTFIHEPYKCKNHSPNGDVGLGCTMQKPWKQGNPLSNTILGILAHHGRKKVLAQQCLAWWSATVYTSLYLHRLRVPHRLHPPPPSPVDSHIPPCMAEYTPLEDWHSWHTSEDMHWHTPAAPSLQCRHQSQYLIYISQLIYVSMI